MAFTKGLIGTDQNEAWYLKERIEDNVTDLLEGQPS
jgi:hypothetical protein